MIEQLKATCSCSSPLKGDDVLSAPRVLGPAIDELDRAAHRCWSRVRLIVMPS